MQVFTKRAAPGDAPRVTGSLEGGSFDTWRGDASVLGGARRRVDYQLGVAYRGSEGAFQDILPEHDTFTQTSIDAGVGAILGDRATLRTGVRYANAKGKAVGPIDYGSRDTGTAADTRDLSWHLDFTHRISDRVDQSATSNYFKSYRLSARHRSAIRPTRLRDPLGHARRALPEQPAARAAARSADIRRAISRAPRRSAPASSWRRRRSA